MTKKLTVICIALLISIINNANAQTDSSTKAGIQMEAIQMRETLNQYLSDKLLVRENNKKREVKSQLIDSISEIISKQHLEIELLKNNFHQMQESVTEIKQTQDNVVKGNILVEGVKRINENLLELYFPFDSYYLTNNQKLVLNKFIGAKTVNEIILSGFSDNIGSENYNKKLAKQRCNSVKKSIKRSINTTIMSFEPCEKTSNDEAVFCRKVLIQLK